MIFNELVEKNENRVPLPGSLPTSILPILFPDGRKWIIQTAPITFGGEKGIEYFFQILFFNTASLVFDLYGLPWSGFLQHRKPVSPEFYR